MKVIAAVRSTRYPACGVLAVCAHRVFVERHWQTGTVRKGKHLDRTPSGRIAYLWAQKGAQSCAAWMR